ncbi:hypothetical protein GUITHDRAFT_149029 [Guillardia theta CCMP2712]|uniref:Uncharacterized protein n=1 Tax=Guillardia theta (strain CCMP2712) TaxID=905079 RepID=L1I7M5_GUITC|nr:hypothetical protein GUITHDRAFT_149029 [Guillardia theta CCMP2712]EKX31845.1 hypothetical protein GUITHDRAFT_149029 [Guillardia theta CCMP2712]|eukprot:XP_005818825.1 hypothetical protein GUITHDRAFT_149029 [Guillardia theta CCMP2712]
MNFVWTQCVDKETQQDITRGEYPNKKRRTAYKKNRRKFDNQISFLFKIDDGYYPNVKVFQNGNIQMTGSRSFEDTIPAVEAILREIQSIAMKDIQIISIDYKKIKYDNFKVRLINTDFRVYQDPEMTERFYLKRKELHRLLIEKNEIIAWFNANTYPGVKIEYWWNKDNPDNKGKRDLSKPVPTKGVISDIKKITIAVFESGSILITASDPVCGIDIIIYAVVSSSCISGYLPGNTEVFHVFLGFRGDMLRIFIGINLANINPTPIICWWYIYI